MVAVVATTRRMRTRRRGLTVVAAVAVERRTAPEATAVLAGLVGVVVAAETPALPPVHVSAVLAGLVVVGVAAPVPTLEQRGPAGLAGLEVAVAAVASPTAVLLATVAPVAPAS